MLSQEEQRHLDEIQHYLEQSDPTLAARLRSGATSRRRPVLLLIVAMVMVLTIASLAVVMGWLAAAVGAVMALSAATAFAVVRSASSP
jgi:hypothetical protein